MTNRKVVGGKTVEDARVSVEIGGAALTMQPDDSNAAVPGYVAIVKRILVALDDSEASQRTAEFVNEFFGGGVYEILGLNVSAAPVPWITAGVGYGVVYPFPEAPAGIASPQLIDEAREQAVKTAEETVMDSGLEGAVPLAAVGEVVSEICRAAEEHDVALIVVGSHDKGAFRRLMTGSVSTTLVHDAPRPVLVVR